MELLFWKKQTKKIKENLAFYHLHKRRYIPESEWDSWGEQYRKEDADSAVLLGFPSLSSPPHPQTSTVQSRS